MFPGGYCAGLGVGGWLLMIGFWGALIAVVIWAVTRLFPSSAASRQASTGDDPVGPARSPQEAHQALPPSRVGTGRR
jgi:putative membrane protein